MRTALVLSALASVVLSHGGPTGALGNAKTVKNAANVMYHANFQSSAIAGSVDIVAGPAGNGLTYTLKVTKAPTNMGALTYFIANEPVSVGTACNASAAVFDPYVRGATPICDNDDPATCQVGDLSGKYGALKVSTAGTASKSFSDYYTSTTIGDFAFIGNRSFVITDSHKMGVACANFMRMEM